MLNGINLNEDLSNIAENKIGVSGVVTNPINNPYKNTDRNLLIDETAISEEAVNLYQKEQEINSFNALAMSDPEDMSHEEIIAGLFDKGISDPFSEEALKETAANVNLLTDLSI